MTHSVKELQSIIESILFASGEPIKVDRLSEVLDTDKDEIRKIIDTIIDKLEYSDSGIRILRLDDSYQMCSKAENAEYVRKAMDMRRKTPLSAAAMEVLAIIAYNQPVTRAFVEQVRGIDSSSIISNLVVKNLIEEKGRLELPGKPLVYGTSSNFLKCFGMSSLDELPEIPQNDKNKEEVSI